MFIVQAGSRSLSHLLQNKNPRVFNPGVLKRLGVFYTYPLRTLPGFDAPLLIRVHIVQYCGR